MDCAQCGARSIDSARYCQQCGAAFDSTEGEQSLSTNPDFELCQLNPYIVKNTGAFERLLNPFATDSWCWCAEIVAINGKETIAESSEFRERYMAGVVPSNHDARAARDELVAKLLREGWEPLDTHYKDQRFRRRISN